MGVKSETNTPTTNDAAWRRQAVAHSRLLGLALAPVVAHLAAFAWSGVRRRLLEFTTADAVVAAMVAGYLVAVVLASRRREHLTRVLLVVYSTLLTLVAGELTVRYAIPTHIAGFGYPWPPGMKRAAMAADTMPGVSGRIELTVNRLGLRGPEVDLDHVDLRILCVGGSTTECVHVTDAQTWPWRLQHALTRELGQRVFVGNAGRSGHFTQHHDYLIRHYPYAPRFEWVVVMCGINDMNNQLFKRNYEERKAKVWRKTFTRTRAREGAYYKRWRLWEMASVTLDRFVDVHYRRVVQQDLAGRHLALRRQERREALSRNPTSKLPPDLERAVDVYKENLRAIIRTCRRRGQPLLMLTQPAMYRADLPPELEALLWLVRGPDVGTTEVLARVMDRYNQAMVDVCRELDTPCLDIAAALPKDTSVFYDDCHFNTAGCEKVAALVTDWFVQRLGAKAGPGPH